MGTASLAIQTWGPRLRMLVARCQHSIAARNGRRVIEVRQTVSIANKATVALLTVEGDRVLVAVTSGCVQFHSLGPRVRIELPVGGAVR